MEEAPGNLGTNARMVEFVKDGIKEVMKKCITEAMTSCPRKSHDDLKKAEVSLSGPGALLGFSLKRSFVISSGDGSEVIC